MSIHYRRYCLFQNILKMCAFKIPDNWVTPETYCKVSKCNVYVNANVLFYWSNLHLLFCYLNFPIYEHSTRSKCAVTLITTRDRTQIKMKTPRESSICTFYSSISQQFISEITVNISFHKRRTARKDRTVCVVLICFIKVHTKGTNSGTTQKNNIPSSL